MCSPFGELGKKGKTVETADLSKNTVPMTTHMGWWEFKRVLEALKPFKTGGALKGVTSVESFGRFADGPQYDQMRSEWFAHEIDYVVYSYATPIAWHNSRANEWRTNNDKYSLTTAKHQSIIFTAISQLNSPR